MSLSACLRPNSHERNVMKTALSAAYPPACILLGFALGCLVDGGLNVSDCNQRNTTYNNLHVHTAEPPKLPPECPCGPNCDCEDCPADCTPVECEGDDCPTPRGPGCSGNAAMNLPKK